MKYDANTQMHLDRIKVIQALNGKDNFYVSCMPGDDGAFNIPNSNRWLRTISIGNVLSFASYCIEKGRREGEMSAHADLDGLYRAMDEYARQEVIAFNRYCGGLPIDFHNRHTLEELYDLYQQQKTQP